jgi:transcriptional regulator with XRE-family HTH domain
MSTEKIQLVGRHISGARGLLRMTIKDLAAAADVAEVTIIDFETGTRVPRQATIEALREALERRGIEFSNGNEPGVKLRPSKATIPV